MCRSSMWRRVFFTPLAEYNGGRFNGGDGINLSNCKLSNKLWHTSFIFDMDNCINFNVWYSVKWVKDEVNKLNNKCHSIIILNVIITDIQTQTNSIHTHDWFDQLKLMEFPMFFLIFVFNFCYVSDCILFCLLHMKSPPKRHLKWLSLNTRTFSTTTKPYQMSYPLDILLNNNVRMWWCLCVCARSRKHFENLKTSKPKNHETEQQLTVSNWHLKPSSRKPEQSNYLIY